ncbi:MAG: hypothetical protein Q8N05_04385 [Bacteroidota bacterium]|nr:hypothetical protein [Bacteroidota bacterium]
MDGSDLIDKGTDVGLPYKGTLPDLGAFEFDLATNPVFNQSGKNEIKASFDHEDLIIRFNRQDYEPFSCSLYRLNGQLAFYYEIKPADQVQKINCTHLPQGIYILKISSGSRL